MSIELDWAMKELQLRAAEQRAVEDAGTWEAFSAMKQRWAFRRRNQGLSRGLAKHWLAVAESKQMVDA